ncbi:MAG: alanine racemase [Burkholderiales bacterium]
MSRPLRARIRRSALAHNLAVARRLAPECRVMAVVKANGYGHGLLRAAAAFAEADAFAALEIEGAVRLREAGHRQEIVLIAGLFDTGELSIAAEHDLSLVVHHEEQVRMLETSRARGLRVFLKINSGMNRLGFLPERAARVLARLEVCDAVAKVVLMTHFADADDARGVAWQLERLQAIPEGGRRAWSLANSAALIRYPKTRVGWVRPGIMLYGSSPFDDETAQSLGLEPAMTLESRVIAVQELTPGERIGYGGTYTADAPLRVGIVACGYADGYPRHAPGGTPILIGGQRTRTLGRVCMDVLFADLSRLPEAGVGTPVVLWGDGLPVEEVAAAAGTVGYELLCALAPRVRIEDT